MDERIPKLESKFEIENGDTVLIYRENMGHMVAVVVNKEGKTVAVSIN